MHNAFFLTFLLLLSTPWPAFAAAKKTDKKSEVYNDLTINQDLQKMLEVQGVNEIYQSCRSKNSKKLENVPSCIWEEVKKNPGMKEAVLQVYNKEMKPESNPQGRAPASTDKNIEINYATDPAAVALSEFYRQKLNKILDPKVGLTDQERKDGVILTIDHKKFIDLYKSELSKTIINAFTSYCVDTDPSKTATCPLGNCAISDESKEERAKHREANIKSLSTANFDGKSEEAQKWTNCILNVSTLCHDGKVEKGEDLKESVKRACVVVDFVKSARKNILIADEQKKFYEKDLSQGNTPEIAANMKVISGDDKASSDAILKTTSKDVEEQLKAGATKLGAEVDSCIKEGSIVDTKKCQAFLNTNTEENEKAFAEFGVRQLAQEDKLTEELSDGGKAQNKVREYLKEEGYKEDEIKGLTANQDSVEDIKKQIIERYKIEKASIIKEMADKIAIKTAAHQGKVDQKDDQEKIQVIKSDIEKRSADLGNLVKFNNVVAAYLDIEIDSGGTKENKRNTASLFAEAENDPQMKEKIKAANLEKIESSPDLEVKMINDNLLKYESKKDEKTSAP